MQRGMLALLLLVLAGCAGQSAPAGDTAEPGKREPPAARQGVPEEEVTRMELSSPAFDNEQPIPRKYSCQGEDVNPQLDISGVPEEAKSLALIVDDPDAPGKTWVHWVLVNIDPTTAQIAEDSVPEGTTQLTNDFNRVEWGGPCPPSGSHRYYFKLYALDTTLDLEGSATKADLESAMEGHILDQAQLMGTYEKA